MQTLREHTTSTASTPPRLTHRERDLLELLRLDNTLTASRIAETYAISARQAERLLITLKQKGVLSRQGSNKTGRWVVHMSHG